MHTVQLSDEAYVGLQQRATAVGLSVAEYLDEVGRAPVEADGFSMTPELNRAISKGIAEADQGKLMSVQESRRRIEGLRSEWQKRD